MNTIILNNIDPIILEKLQVLSQRHNRTLEEEVTAIITEVAGNNILGKEEEFNQAWAKVDAARQQPEGKVFSGSTEFLREDRRD